jgi:sulfite reductase alpha subunit-like flavoprotein
MCPFPIGLNFRCLPAMVAHTLLLVTCITSRSLEVVFATWDSNTEGSHFPTWSRAAHLDINVDESITSMSLEGSCVTIPLSDSAIIWNWETDEWATIYPQNDGAVSRFSLDEHMASDWPILQIGSRRVAEPS